MAPGWLTPWSIFQQPLNKYIIKQEDGLGPSWEFPNSQGVVSLLSAAGILLSSAESLTVDAGLESITPTLGIDPIKVVNVSGAGAVADDLAQITVPAAWVGKLILVKMANAGTITIKANANIRMAADVILDSIYDRSLFEVIAANTVVKLFDVSNA